MRENDGGLYTCRLRGNHRTAGSTTVTVEPGECIVSLLSVFHYAAYMTCKYYINIPKINLHGLTFVELGI